MSSIGTSVAQSVAGLHQSERTSAKEAKRAEKPRDPKRTRSAEDQLEISHAESIEAVRHLGDNTEEETREDRQERPLPEHPPGEKPGRRIDLEG
ncbi:MAG: hypothetical protein ACF8SC_04380 [Phycisphaerales bacterium JB037]